MEDLEVLVKEKNYAEFLKHTHDVRPSKRDKKWKQMTRDMALGHLNASISNKKFDLKTFEFVEKLNSWPTLRNEEFFQQKRNYFGIEHLKYCFSNSKNCLSKALNFWHSNLLKSPDLGHKMAILLSKNKYDKDLFPFIKPVTTSDISEFYCNRSEVQKILFKKIHEISLIGPPSKKVFSDIFNQACLEKIIPILKKDLVNISSAPTKELFYNFLNLYEVLNQEEKDFFLTLYVLQGPVKGNAFNAAWNIIKILGKNYKRRSKVIKKLESFDLLPDEIFALPDQKTRKTLIDYFSLNIPEYLDYYARTCLDYLEGKREFPRGNPTLHCKNLFREAKGTKWVDPGLQKQFGKFKKL